MVGKLGVIVPVTNQPGWTGLILHELVFKTANPCRKLIVDNASDEPRTLAMLKKIDGKQGFEVLRNEKNMGVAVSWNQGANWAQQAGLDYLAILNNDLTLPAGWDDILLDELKKPEIYLSALSPLQSACFAPFCFMVKVEIFDKVGLFGEEWKYGHEELDYMVRMHLAGVKWVNVNTDDYPEFYHAGIQSKKEMFESDEEFSEYNKESRALFDAKWKHLGRIEDFLVGTYNQVGNNKR